MLSALLYMLCLNQREGVVTGSLVLIPALQPPPGSVLISRPAVIRTAALSSSNVKFLGTAHYQQDILSRAWKNKGSVFAFSKRLFAAEI